MTDHTRHPLSGNNRHGLDNISEGLADTLDGITKGVGEIFGDLGKGLVDFLKSLSSDDKEKKPNEAEKKDAYATAKTWHDMEPDDDKRRAVGSAADYIKDQFKPADRDSGQREVSDTQPIRERVIEVPQYIKDMPGYEVTLARQREMVAQEMARQYQGMASTARMEASDAREKMHEQQQRHEARQDPATPGIEKDDPDPYAQAARELDAKPLQEGQEIEGEVVEVAKVDGKNYYVIEQDGERVAVPAGDKPAFDKGDEITAERTKGGFETTGADYDYGR
jgi:Sec-independent protein translocase protein TatA